MGAGMRVILLAANEHEALSYARAASIPTRDFIVPRSGRNLEGLRLESGDLIFQFYSFINHPRRQEICEVLHGIVARVAGEKPRWERAGQ
jgi:hypothetical protein